MSGQYTSRLDKIEAVLTENLPKTPGAEWVGQSFGELPLDITLTDIEKLAEPTFRLIDLGGKRWRPLVLVLSAEIASAPLRDLPDEVEAALGNAYKLTPLVEFVHTASLIHDDIEDRADMRRGKPAAHHVYGLDFALNAGSWAYFQAAACVSGTTFDEETKNKILSIYFQEVRRLHLGQSLDISWHNNPATVPTESQYLAMVGLKTGTLASLAAQVGFIAGGGSPDEAEALAANVKNIGIGFQILDDVTNLTTGNKGKNRGDDIVEGKKSLPIILYLEKHPENKEKILKLFETAAKEGKDSPAIQECISMLDESGAVEEASLRSRSLIKKNCAAITKAYPDMEAATLLTGFFTSMLI